MKKAKLFFILDIVTSSDSFKKQKEKNQEEDTQTIEEQFNSIEKLSEIKTCIDGSVWRYTAYGNKACGGPVGYIAYSKKVEKEFLDMVEQYTADQKAYNEKWGVASTCDVPPAPESVDCVDGLPVLVY